MNGLTITDPYVNSSTWEDNITKWPSVEHGNIHNYLINTPGIYTKEAMLAYKSLDGYNFFVSGHVQTCLYNEVSSDSPVCVMKAKVTPSQRIREKSHEPWVIIHKTNGYVVAAHCTCKAGLGEACSHVAALLFKINAASTLGLNTESKTSLKCIWNRFYRKQVDAVPVTEMNLTKPAHGKNRQPKRKTPEPVLPESEDEFNEEEALQQLKQICPNACILTKTDSDTDSASDDEDLPPILTRFHEVEYTTLPEDEFRQKCENFLRDFTVSQNQTTNLELITRSQAESALWKRQREGRITATIAHDIKTRRDSTSSKALLLKVMKYNDTDLSKVEAISFGNKYEKVAKELYMQHMLYKHEDFKLRDCGLVIDKAFPLFAATPDGVRSCACHGDGLVEVKCCYKHKDLAVRDIPAQDSGFYLEKDTLTLREGHRYYTQVQFQMYVLEKTYCDFVVYTNKGIHVQTVTYNASFVNNLIAKCTNFAVNELVPEILRHKLK